MLSSSITKQSNENAAKAGLCAGRVESAMVIGKSRRENIGHGAESVLGSS